MPSFEKLISFGDSISDDMQMELLVSTRKAEKIIYEELLKVLEKVNVSAGKLSNSKTARQFLLTLDDRIYNVLQKSAYGEGVRRFVKNFDKLEKNSLQISELINSEKIPTRLIDPITQVEVQNTIDRLLVSGVNNSFTIPVREALYRNIALGQSITDAEKTIEAFVKTTAGQESRLLKYVKQVSRDSIQQYDGSIQQKIAEELGTNGLIYAGSLVSDSRSQCARWVKMKEICNNELASEIRWAYKNGSGMIPGTTPSNFAILRGGYNCRHRAFAARVKGCK